MPNQNRILTVVSVLIMISTLARAQERPGQGGFGQLDRDLSALNSTAPLNPSKAAGAPAPTFTFEIVAFPGVDARQLASGINDHGRIVGTYTTVSPDRNGYLLQGTNFKKIVYPGSGTNITRAIGINRSGVVVGLYSSDQGATEHGFVMKGNNFTSLDYPGASMTTANAINAKGVIVGASSTGQNIFHGFMLSGGTYTQLDYPSSLSTLAYGINASGEIVGLYQQADGTYHGFTLQNGVYANVDYPGATETDLLGINDSGQMVGYYSDDGGTTYHAFLLDAGVFTPFDVPFGGATRTFAHGINNHNQIVGGYVDSAGYLLGFVASFQ